MPGSVKPAALKGYAKHPLRFDVLAYTPFNYRIGFTNGAGVCNNTSFITLLTGSIASYS